MPQIRYVTQGVPKWGTGAFTPVVPPTPLASTGGEQSRYVQQWTDAQDPNLAGMAATSILNLSYQPSYANVGRTPDQAGLPGYGGSGAGPNGAGAGIPDKTYVPGLPLAFRPVVNAKHHMAYWTRAFNTSDVQTMGPNGQNTHMKIYSDNPLPMPAQNPGRVVPVAMRTTPIGTPIATAWPRPFLTWPTWGQSRQA